jgi:short-subunit dehydrogenase
MANSRPVALITGASSGIGLDFAWVLAEHQHDVVLVARTFSTLERVAREISEKHGVTATPIPFDLTDPSAPKALYDSLLDRGIVVDVLVNNAGFGTGGRFDRIEIRKHLDLIQVNITALTELTWRFLPGMLERNRGRILNVASTAAFQPGPLLAVYYASKSYVLSLTEAIAEEVRDTNVTLTALCPGPTHTKFAEVAELRRTHLFNTPLTMRSREVAEFGYNAMMRGKRLAVPGFTNRLVAFGNRLVPRRVATRIARKLQENVL